ncbi:MAG: hypothetical protein IT514_06615 [Burkholderiales bacterium]|nr:hypothetical protein [Burkholderiales bacterium]
MDAKVTPYSKEALRAAQLAFHLTGRRGEVGLDPLEDLDLRPALLAGYRDLTALRYDFPVVLLHGAGEGPCIASLSSVMDGVLEKTAPAGTEGARARRNLLRLECEMRRIVAAGDPGSLAGRWSAALERLAARGQALPEDLASKARAALAVDGEVLDCDAAMPARVLRHAWNAVQEGRARRFHALVDRLLARLNEILRADFVGSESGRQPEQLKAMVGSAHADAFDFEAMSRILSRVPHHAALSDSRRARIGRLIAVLGSQRFFPAEREGVEPGGKAAKAAAYNFVFDGCVAAHKALRERWGKLVEVAKAIAVAELEVAGEYSEARHDALFESYGGNGLDPQDLAMFPSYLVCLRAASGAEMARVLDLLSGGLPVKVLVQSDDLLEESLAGGAQLLLGVRARQLADAAIGLNHAYVLQASASHLVCCRERVQRGLDWAGPALFSVYSGEAGRAAGLPPYLAAAAAMEARVFPAFTYDPSAGEDWASRLRIEDNPQVERDWPVQGFGYEDEEHQNISQLLAFTAADFIALDPRAAPHFARIAKEHWNDGMVAVREAVERSERLPEKVPSLLMVDGDNALHKVVVGERVIREARRIGGAWRSLQELGGVRNSHAERLLAKEQVAWEEKRKAWEEQARREAQARGRQEASSQTAAPQAVPAAAAAAVETEPAKAAPSGDPWIETPRCTTCEECVRLNNRMFVYDGNKQAYIADAGAGTFRELVEAAESCQVSIIHPGKPKNPNEPGLEDLVKRAEPFQ